MDARTIIEAVRDRRRLEEDELRWFASGLASGQVSDAQAGAFAMAVLLNGLTDPERVALTLAMRDSGDRMSWDLPGPAIDKHSTGGIGDSVSLVLAPMLASVGAFVPMISGRGLGHTGGTLDKLEAIPGVSTDVSEAQFREMVARTGAAIVSATGDLAPADRRLYAIRDVTGTVESVDLITASILSKKLAAGLDALILDVKAGSGAFMTDPDAAGRLAEALVATANGAGCRTVALITAMDQPLAPSLGNALEIREVLAALSGAGGRLVELSVRLAAELLVIAGLEDDLPGAEDRLRQGLTSGRAAEIFGRMVADLGGPPDLVESGGAALPRAEVIRPVEATGPVASIDGHGLGLAVVALGGGRQREGDDIDPAVGLSSCLEIGATAGKDRPLAVIHAADEASADAAEKAVREAYVLGEGADPLPLVIRRMV